MGTAVQVQLSNGFVNFANSFASSYTAGIFNLLFIPKEDEATGQTVLQFASFAGLTDLRVAHQSFIGRVQNIPVWSVLPEESQFGPVKHNIYWILLLILALICLIALVIACVLLTITCCCGKCMKNGCNRKKKMKENIYAPSSSEPSAAMRQNRNCGPNRGRVYLSIGIICIIELVVLYGLCVPAFYSLSTLDSPGTSSAVRDAENIGQPNGTNRSTSFKLSTSFGMALDQLQVFLENIAPEGGAETDRTIASVNASLANNLALLVRGILNRLLISYEVQPVLDQGDQLQSSLIVLLNTTEYISNVSGQILNDMSTLQGEIHGYRTALTKAFGDLCPKLTSSLIGPACLSLQSHTSVLTYNFDSSAILVEPSIVLSELTAIFGVNLTTLNEKINTLRGELNDQADTILNQTLNQFDLNSLFDPIKQLWTNVSTELNPTLNTVKKSRVSVEKVADLYQLTVVVFGYVLLVVCLILLVALTVYLLIYGSECHERSLLTESNNGSDTYPPAHISPKPLMITIAVSGIILFLLLVIRAALIVISVIAMNDVCRYGITPAGQNQTDAVMNLYLQSVWPTFIDRIQLQPEVKAMTQLSAPRNVVQGLLVRCPDNLRTVANGTIPTAPTTTPTGLLPLIGLDNIVNVTGVLQSSTVQNAIQNNEKTLVDEILKVNFASYIPSDIDNIFTVIENITYYLDNSNYNKTIEQLIVPQINTTAVNQYVQQLQSFASPLAETHSEARTILITASAIEARMQTADSEYKKANRLGQAFIALQQQSNFTGHLRIINASLTNLKSILTNSTLIEEPIRPAYQSSVQNFLGNMSLDLETETTRFTGALLPCHRLSSAVSITVQTFCANSAAIQGLGSNSLIAFAITFILLITFLCFQIFIQLHQKHCLHASNQGIPLYLFVRYIHKTKNE
ncbi:hypothetical protein FBUS_00015 [Fasciolopsis buskii]|uniref:Uncharacterized protein n=1 Tax=Fasciolopsis buskii TaxID=27845 RepID=A0A8E0RQ31_9TREM|nr:hypothetical protein FBUS_00015 [Fasciolopsis buski]